MEKVQKPAQNLSIIKFSNKKRFDCKRIGLFKLIFYPFHIVLSVVKFIFFYFLFVDGKSGS